MRQIRTCSKCKRRIPASVTKHHKVNVFGDVKETVTYSFYKHRHGRHLCGNSHRRHSYTYKI